MQRPGLLIFDVIETLLDITSIKNAINHEFSNENAFKSWFSTLLHSSLVETTTGTYHDFGQLGKAALQTTSLALNHQLREEKAAGILKMMTELPPHPDVVNGLKLLKDSEFISVTLTNSAYESARKQLDHSGLTQYFHRIFSVGEVKKYKPHRDTYLHVTGQMGVKPTEAMLIAAHGWDIKGAKDAGLQAAFLSRPGQFLYPLAPAPEFNEPDLEKLARRLIKL